MSIGSLINALSRQDTKRESYSIRRKFRKSNLNKLIKKQNVSKNDLRKAKELHNMSIDNLQKIAILRRIKNYDNLSREDLIYTILRSESNLVESNYMKYINNNTDDKIKAKINNIRIILSRLGNIVTKNNRNKIRKELYEIEKSKDLQKAKKKGFIIALLNKQIPLIRKKIINIVIMMI